MDDQIKAAAVSPIELALSHGEAIADAARNSLKILIAETLREILCEMLSDPSVLAAQDKTPPAEG